MACAPLPASSLVSLLRWRFSRPFPSCIRLKPLDLGLEPASLEALKESPLVVGEPALVEAKQAEAWARAQALAQAEVEAEAIMEVAARMLALEEDSLQLGQQVAEVLVLVVEQVLAIMVVLTKLEAIMLVAAKQVELIMEVLTMLVEQLELELQGLGYLKVQEQHQ